MAHRKPKPPETMTKLPYPNKRCRTCDYCTDAVTYYGEEGTNYHLCIDERSIEGHMNPLCGEPTDADGFGCIRWESL